MTEETNTETENQETQVSAEVEQLMADNAAMKAKMDELLTEAKKAKQAKRDIESETQSERERIAKEKGDYEQLHKSSQERYESTVAELESLRGTIAQEKKGNVAMKLAR